MYRQQSPIVDVLAEEQRNAARQAARSLPLVALSESIQPSTGWISDWEHVDDMVTNVDISYGSATSDVSQVTVATSRWAGTKTSAGPLRWLLQHYLRLDGQRFSEMDWAESTTTIVIGGQPVTGHLVCVGSRWWAARCQHGDIEISIVARDWHPTSIAVDTVTDVEPLLPQCAEMRPRMHADPTASVKPPQAPIRDPLRAFVELHLEHAREQIVWWADGGPPPAFPPQTSTLRKAAVQRYVMLTDQSEPQAKRAVADVVSHLCNLFHNAAWFRDALQLRERAIAETLLFSTGLNDNVSSLRAQHAWRRKNGQQTPVSPTDIDDHAAIDHEWINAWLAWTTSQLE